MPRCARYNLHTAQNRKNAPVPWNRGIFSVIQGKNTSDPVGDNIEIVVKTYLIHLNIAVMQVEVCHLHGIRPHIDVTGCKVIVRFPDNGVHMLGSLINRIVRCYHGIFLPQMSAPCKGYDLEVEDMYIPLSGVKENFPAELDKEKTISSAVMYPASQSCVLLMKSALQAPINRTAYVAFALDGVS